MLSGDHGIISLRSRRAAEGREERHQKADRPGAQGRRVRSQGAPDRRACPGWWLFYQLIKNGGCVSVAGKRERFMAPNPQTPGIVAGRLDAAALAENFADIAPALSAHEAWVAADRCYFCHDAPCTAACPTSIDVPLFIREIATGAVEAAARTILSQNILGGMCARVCPTETLCEEACVREAAEGRPVEIGRLQRYATDTLMAKPGHPFERAAPTGKQVAVVGAGPAGLACAHRLAMLGHEVVLMDARPKGGGLNEFGIAAYKTVDGFAQAELAWLLGIGGITIQYGRALGQGVSLEELRDGFDAVFLGIGLGGVKAL
jgi:glutamate synthase (NADPH/NADH) small chain